MISDQECIEKIRQGQSHLFDQLVRKYQSGILNLVFKHVRNEETARDLTQDVFFKVFRKLNDFKGDSKFSSWLYRVAVNESIDYLRSKKSRKEESLDLAVEHGYEVADPSEKADIYASHERKREKQRIRSAINALTPDMRSVIILKVYEERTFEDIAEILEIPTSTVKSRLYKALETLGRNYRRRILMREVT